MVIPDLHLLFVVGDESQELHQRPLGLEVELMVLENILTPVRDFEKLLGIAFAFSGVGIVAISVYPPAADG